MIRGSWVGIHSYMSSCYWSNTHTGCWLATWGCACDTGMVIGQYLEIYEWSGHDQYMYMKGELNHHNCFGMCYELTTYTQKCVKGISNSSWMFIDVLQPVTNKTVCMSQISALKSGNGNATWYNYVLELMTKSVWIPMFVVPLYEWGPVQIERPRQRQRQRHR